MASERAGGLTLPRVLALLFVWLPLVGVCIFILVAVTIATFPFGLVGLVLFALVLRGKIIRASRGRQP